MQLKKTTPPRRPHRHIPVSPRLAEVIPPRLFKALCDPNRIALLARLSECGRPCGVTELSGCCAVDFSVVSRHLRTLREAGVLASTRRGKEIYYEVRAPELVRTLRAIADVIERCCGCASSPAAPSGGPADAAGSTATARGKSKPVATGSHRAATSGHNAATGRKDKR